MEEQEQQPAGSSMGVLHLLSRSSESMLKASIAAELQHTDISSQSAILGGDGRSSRRWSSARPPQAAG